MSRPQPIEALLKSFREEHAVLGAIIIQLEQLQKLRSQATTVKSIHSQQLPLPDQQNSSNPTAPKGIISIRRAIRDVLKESGQAMHAKDIWQMAFSRGARTAAKRPESIVALTSLGIEEIEQVGPRTFKWKG